MIKNPINEDILLEDPSPPQFMAAREQICKVNLEIPRPLLAGDGGSGSIRTFEEVKSKGD
jgi:hypothetical protein